MHLRWVGLGWVVVAGWLTGCVAQSDEPGEGAAGGRSDDETAGAGRGTAGRGGTGSPPGGTGGSTAGAGGSDPAAGAGGALGGSAGSGSTQAAGAGGKGGGAAGNAGSSAGAGGTAGSAGAGSSNDLSVSLAYPFLLRPWDPKATPVFPGYLAHLLGASISSPLVDPELVCVTAKNTGGTNKQVDITVDLVGYATPLTKSVLVKPGASEHCLSPVPNLEKIYGLSASVPVVIAVKLRDVATGEEFSGAKEAVLTASQTAFNAKLDASSQPQLAYEAHAVFVTPQNAALQTFYTEVTKQSRWGTFGLGGYDMHEKTYTKPAQSIVPPKTAAHVDNVYLEAGESVTLAVDEVSCSACTSKSVGLLFLDGAQTAAFTNACQPPVAPTPAGTGTSFTLTANTAGWHTIFFLNGCDNFTDRQVTFRRTGSTADAAQDVLRATFEALKARGVTYVNVAESFSDPAATQTIRLPETSLTDTAANCIDGSVLFASIAEKAALEPVIVYVPGHAFMGVRSRAGSQLVWPVETTMVGNASFGDALEYGIGEYNGMVHAADIDVKQARGVGFVAMPRLGTPRRGHVTRALSATGGRPRAPRRNRLRIPWGSPATGSPAAPNMLNTS